MKWRIVQTPDGIYYVQYRWLFWWFHQKYECSRGCYITMCYRFLEEAKKRVGIKYFYLERNKIVYEKEI